MASSLQSMGSNEQKRQSLTPEPSPAIWVLQSHSAPWERVYNSTTRAAFLQLFNSALQVKNHVLSTMKAKINIPKDTDTKLASAISYLSSAIGPLGGQLEKPKENRDAIASTCRGLKEALAKSNALFSQFSAVFNPAGVGAKVSKDDFKSPKDDKKDSILSMVTNALKLSDNRDSSDLTEMDKQFVRWADVLGGLKTELDRHQQAFLSLVDPFKKEIAQLQNELVLADKYQFSSGIENDESFNRMAFTLRHTMLSFQLEVAIHAQKTEFNSNCKLHRELLTDWNQTCLYSAEAQNKEWIVQQLYKVVMPALGVAIEIENLAGPSQKLKAASEMVKVNSTTGTIRHSVDSYNGIMRAFGGQLRSQIEKRRIEFEGLIAQFLEKFVSATLATKPFIGDEKEYSKVEKATNDEVLQGELQASVSEMAERLRKELMDTLKQCVDYWNGICMDALLVQDDLEQSSFILHLFPQLLDMEENYKRIGDNLRSTRKHNSNREDHVRMHNSCKADLVALEKDFDKEETYGAKSLPMDENVMHFSKSKYENICSYLRAEETGDDDIQLKAWGFVWYDNESKLVLQKKLEGHLNLISQKKKMLLDKLKSKYKAFDVAKAFAKYEFEWMGSALQNESNKKLPNFTQAYGKKSVNTMTTKGTSFVSSIANTGSAIAGWFGNPFSSGTQTVSADEYVDAPAVPMTSGAAPAGAGATATTLVVVKPKPAESASKA